MRRRAIWLIDLVCWYSMQCLASSVAMARSSEEATQASNKLFLIVSMLLSEGGHEGVEPFKRDGAARWAEEKPSRSLRWKEGGAERT